ncbi:MAG: peptidase C39 [Clostridia bacterium]|nr:peptidase C39 [Clostridia bacterium]
MHVPLQYQISEYDCGPTSVMNAVSFLFEQKDIHPDMIKGIYCYCLDGFDCHGEMGKTGTGRCAMEFLSKWFNQYGTQRNFPIHTELLRSEDIYLGEDSPIVKGLRAGGVALVRCRLGCEHYVLLTGLCGEDKVYMFDPYYLKKPLRRRDIEMLEGQPCFANRIVTFARLNRADRDYYAMGQQDARQCVLFFNTAQGQPTEAT